MKQNCPKTPAIIKQVGFLFTLLFVTFSLNAQIVCSNQVTSETAASALTFTNIEAQVGVSITGTDVTVTDTGTHPPSGNFMRFGISDQVFTLPIHMEFTSDAFATSQLLAGFIGVGDGTTVGYTDIFSGTPSATYHALRGGVNSTQTSIGGIQVAGHTAQNGVHFEINIEADGSVEMIADGTAFATGSVTPDGAGYRVMLGYRHFGAGPHSKTLSNFRVYEYAEVCQAVIVDLDGDGIDDRDDLDDDNDGIPDVDEQSACSATGLASSANVIFLNEDFGSGTTKSEMTGFSSTTYIYDSGPNDVGVTTSGQFLVDGEYVLSSLVHNNNGTVFTGSNWGDPHDDLAIWAEAIWTAEGDHTGDPDGKMAIFNAAGTAGTFYTSSITGVEPSVNLIIRFWARNIDSDDTGRIKPIISLSLYGGSDPGRTSAVFTQATATTLDGENGVNAGWQEFIFEVPNGVLTENEYYLDFNNGAPGGAGNDLALDDISAEQNLCDSDNDGIPNTRDLDDDGDGIPTIVELGITTDTNKSGTLFNSGSWTDAGAPGDGIHDTYVGITPLDTDNDGTPDYLDYDSDNDGIFDIVEYDGLGDADITGDGKPDIADADGDGIADLYDPYVGFGTYDGSTVNGYPNPANSGPGAADYINTRSDGTNDDIDGTIFTALDADNDGEIDDTTDVDEDGLPASLDTNDGTFGSPRDFSDSYSINFDGRNDYIEDSNVIGAGDVTIMAFIKPDGANTLATDQFIAGQDNFYLQLNTSNQIQAVINGGTTLTYPVAISNGIWSHIAATTTGGSTVLYLNGKEVVSNGSVGSMAADGSNFRIGAASGNINYFHGEIDELRFFRTNLSDTEIRRMVYQELDDADFTRGEVTNTLPLSIATGSNYGAGDLVRYFKLDRYVDDILYNHIQGGTSATTATIYNVHELEIQTTPLPFESNVASGDIDTPATWLNYDCQDTSVLTHSLSNANSGTYDQFPIVRINSGHTITADVTQLYAGLVVDGTLIVEEGTGDTQHGTPIFVTDYLRVDGIIDFNDESQLIQTDGSMFDTASTGEIHIDQQGVGDSHVYNYWSPPVTAVVGAASTIPSILYHSSSAPGSNVAETFCVDFDCADDAIENTSAYWLYKFTPGDFIYANWDFLGTAGTLNPGEGFTMKGSTVAGSGTNTYDRTFIGLPNNATINPVTFSTAGDYALVGNPYASAIDADQFIDDNVRGGSGTQSIEGTLYFWEHFSENTHVLAEYQGGYGTYTKAAAVAPVSRAHLVVPGSINTGGTSATTPTRYIPVGQGFFVEGNTSAATGSVQFANSQRLFKDESGDNTWNNGSNFLRGEKEVVAQEENDVKEIIKLQFESPENYTRTVAIAFLEGASDAIDYGYDGFMNDNENFRNDAYFIQEGQRIVVQAYGEFDVDREIPVVILIDEAHDGGTEKISLGSLDNIPLDREIYLKDKLTGIYHDLRAGTYEVILSAGFHSDRFSIVFQKGENQENTLSINEESLSNDIKIYMDNGASSIEITNQSEAGIESVQLYNQAGQLVSSWTGTTLENDKISLGVILSTGIYIASVQTTEGKIAKKLAVK